MPLWPQEEPPDIEVIVEVTWLMPTHQTLMHAPLLFSCTFPFQTFHDLLSERWMSPSGSWRKFLKLFGD